MKTRRFIIFYDGFCKLCSASVQFVIKHDRRKNFLFVPLQSESAAKFLSELPQDKQHADSIVYAEGKKIYFRSSAVLKILNRMGGVWKLFYVFILIPRPLRDYIYNLIARYRMNWFGRNVSCYIPGHEDIPGAEHTPE